MRTNQEASEINYQKGELVECRRSSFLKGKDSDFVLLVRGSLARIYEYGNDSVSLFIGNPDDGFIWTGEKDVPKRSYMVTIKKEHFFKNWSKPVSIPFEIMKQDVCTCL